MQAGQTSLLQVTVLDKTAMDGPSAPSPPGGGGQVGQPDTSRGGISVHGPTTLLPLVNSAKAPIVSVLSLLSLVVSLLSLVVSFQCLLALHGCKDPIPAISGCQSPTPAVSNISHFPCSDFLLMVVPSRGILV